MPKKSKPETLVPAPGSNSAADLIGQYADTVAKHMDELDDIREFIKAAKQEAKAHGLDMTALLQVVKAKRLATQQPRLERETLNRLYLKAAGYEVAE